MTIHYLFVGRGPFLDSQVFAVHPRADRSRGLLLDLAYWLRPPQKRMHWWLQHMAGMIGTCIATVTAFLAVNASVAGIQSSYLVLAVFLGPTLIGVPGMFVWQRW